MGASPPPARFPVSSVLFNFVLSDKRRRPAWNMAVWALLFVGQALLVTLYSLEYYAHVHCPLQVSPGLFVAATGHAALCGAQAGHAHGPAVAVSVCPVGQRGLGLSRARCIPDRELSPQDTFWGQLTPCSWSRAM